MMVRINNAAMIIYPKERLSVIPVIRYPTIAIAPHIREYGA